MRVITRLDETCREVRDAARVIGDTELFNKMEEAQALIKRDSESSLLPVWLARRSCMTGADHAVVFAASLVSTACFVLANTADDAVSIIGRIVTAWSGDHQQLA